MKENFLEKSSEPCPKCGVFSLAGAKECTGCGLIFKKWESQTLGGHVGSSQRLELAWETALMNWEQPLFHDNFINQANLEKNLPFASLKYRRILEADPTNEVALKRRDQVLQLVMVSFMTPEKDVAGETFSRSVYTLLILGVFLVLIGLVTPPSMSGVGAPLVGLGIICVVGAWFVRRIEQ
jgi:hypothetical protein